jgi:oxaloacetate decarboxylase (Na+ extruding) subunit alpha
MCASFVQPQVWPFTSTAPSVVDKPLSGDCNNDQQALGITDVVLRDAHQSMLATRLRLEDMLPIAPKLDQVGFWSVETWGGATFDACIRYLGEDPWDRIRELKKAMPNTRQQMLLRGQNLLGYRHYADDVVETSLSSAPPSMALMCSAYLMR